MAHQSKSVSQQSYIDESGRRVTKTTTTILHPDGREETTTDEHVDDAPSARRIGHLGERAGRALGVPTSASGRNQSSRPALGSSSSSSRQWRRSPRDGAPQRGSFL
uniref:Uncharacterized protein n=2 Tax=Rhizochromulina marina TaxID=1034831 RepID=A0A7S2WGG2_9STRA